MILKQKPIDQKSDAQLDKELIQAVKRSSWLRRHSKDVSHGIALVLFPTGWFTAKAMITAGMAMAGTAGLPLVLGGLVAAPAIWALGTVGCAIGWTTIYDKLFSGFRKKAHDIQKEKEERAYKKTPAYGRALQWAKQEAVRAKEELKKAFNNAVEKAFHTGTETEVKVKKPLQLKKPDEQPKKKSFFGLGQ